MLKNNMRILHVTESLGGGVTSAINSYIKSTNEYHHFLCATIRKSDLTGEEKFKKNVYILPRSIKSVYNFYKIYNKIKPAIIHIHSTFAGVIIRLLPFIPKDKIVYTPHGFSFLRNDSWLVLKLYRLVEQILSYRTNKLAACSKEEYFEATKFYKKSKTLELYNIADFDIKKKIFQKKPSNFYFTVGMVGRISEQKGVNFFIDTVKYFKKRKDVNFIWVGGGDQTLEAKLKSQDIEVTGWLKRNEVLKKLNSLNLYFHTAEWEGFPITVLEAARLKKFLLLRSIRSFSLENLYVVKTPLKASRVISEVLLNNRIIRNDLKENYISINKYHSRSNLRKSLIRLYSKEK